MNALTRCCEYLESNHIQYARWIHPPAYSAREVASSAEIPAHSVAKTVIYCGDNGYGMLLVPADSTIDFTEVRRLLGLSEIRLAAEAELAKLFPDSELGAMPPLGNLRSDAGSGGHGLNRIGVHLLQWRHSPGRH